MTEAPEFRAWFAGFVAGEGHFRIDARKRGTLLYYCCAFQIALRADDGAVLRGLQRRLGGRLYFADSEAHMQGGRNPALSWSMTSKRDVRRIAAVLDGVPLYGKKQRDYDIWRRAVTMWLDGRKGARGWASAIETEEIGRLRAALLATRAYDPQATESLRDPFAEPLTEHEPLPENWGPRECRRGHPRSEYGRAREDGTLRCKQCDRERMARARATDPRYRRHRRRSLVTPSLALFDPA